MKTKMLQGWRWMLAVSSTMVLLGCLDETSGSAETESDAAGANSVAVSEVDNSKSENLPIHVAIPPADLSPGVAELVKLAQSGVGEEVLLAYIQKSTQSFDPTVDEIVYLKDIGLPDVVLAEVVRKGDFPHEVAKTVLSPETTNVIESAPTNLTAPGLTEPAAPSYSVTAEPASVPEAPEQVNINYFESALSPYGTWVDVADYGRCWQPTVVVINRNWRPYSDRGRWIYTTSGWYWQSDYSWGWAPFHYGRWHCDSRIGWVWVPGSTWGPAWVSWRYTDRYCGWAPLPPYAHYDGFGFRYRNSRVGISFDFGLPDHCFTFIPVDRFCDRTPHRYFVSRSHSTTIFHNSVVINNYIRVNNTIINEGVGRDRIVKATQTPIRTVPLRDLPTTGTPPVGRTERLEGNSLSVFRPNVSLLSATASPSRTLSGATSVSATSPTAQNSAAQSISPNRNTRSITGTETSSTTLGQTQTPVVTTAPPRQVQPNPVTQGSSATATIRNLPVRNQPQTPSTATASPNVEPAPTILLPTGGIKPMKPSIGSSTPMPTGGIRPSTSSVNAPAPVTQNPPGQSVSPNRNIRSITRTEAPTQVQTPVVTTPPVRQTQTPGTITPNLAPTGGIRPSIDSLPTKNSSSIRNSPVQNQAQETRKSIVREVNSAPSETPRSIQKSTPTIVRTPEPIQTPTTRVIVSPPVRSQPTIQTPQPQPATRDRRQDFFDQRSAGGSVRSIAPTPAPIAPPAQQFNAPQRSQPAPSVSAPRESVIPRAPAVQAAPASQERTDRGNRPR